MVFSTPIFLFGFLPIVLLVYYGMPGRIKNICLLGASLFFYAWGEVFYIWIMLVSILANYLAGRGLGAVRKPLFKKGVLGIGISVNLLLLCSFKYANFLTDNFNVLLTRAALDPVVISQVHLPLGISFFTFQAISYLVDVFRGKAIVQKKILDLALYIALFPQLIAGPIVRYAHVARQISARSHTPALFLSGMRRFIYGMAKKILIANPLGQVADSIFGQPGDMLSTPVAWLGAFCYALQIYYDFSGYSDMAIGLGRLFGFKFQENFNYPYAADSLRDFWRRWHISLSTWFRDYLYIPLGGNRVGKWRLHLNLVFVFFLCGLWHGANWTFVAWGLVHGGFLALERTAFSQFLRRLWRPIQHVYTMLVVVVAWVLFRADTLSQSLDYFKVMTGVAAPGAGAYPIAEYWSTEAGLAALAGSLLAAPIYPYTLGKLNTFFEGCGPSAKVSARSVYFAGFCMLTFLVMVKLSSATYNPFIYFRF